MFSRLTDFSYQRDKIEALDFFCDYVMLATLLDIIVDFVITALAHACHYPLGREANLLIDSTQGAVYSFSIALLTLKEKNFIREGNSLLENFNYISLAVLSGTIGFFFSPCFGLIPPAYLTTKPAVNTKQRRA